jgi:hypothetical protein
MRRFLLATLVLLGPLAASAQSLRSAWRYVDLGPRVGGVGNWVGDLDGDGDEEIVVGSGVPRGANYDHSVVAVLDAEGGGYVTHWTSPWYGRGSWWDDLSRVLVANLDGDADAEIYAFVNDGRLDVYDGSTGALAATHTLHEGGVKNAVFADVDDDGAAELVALQSTGLRVYDAATFAEEWSTASYGDATDLAVGDVDGDDEAEIVLASGHVLGGASHALEWAYPGGFGYGPVALGDTDGDAPLEILAVFDTHLRAFDAARQALLWELYVEYDLAALLVTDVEGDGAREVIVGAGQWGSVWAYDLRTQAFRWYQDNPGYGVTRLATGDPNGDGVPEVVWGEEGTSSTPPRLFVASAATHEVEWEGDDFPGPYFVGAADVSGDETPELVAASMRSSTQDGIVRAYDGTTHDSLWTAYAYYHIRDIATGDVTGDGRDDVVYGLEGSVRIVDGATGTTLDPLPTPSFTRVVEVADLNGDGLADVLGGFEGGEVRAWAGGTFGPLWAFDASGGVHDIAVAACDADAAPELVFLNMFVGVQVYDAATHALEWEGRWPEGTTALTTADLDLDGTDEILTGHNDGTVRRTACETFETEVPVAVAPGAYIRALSTAALDGGPEPEVLAVAGEVTGRDTRLLVLRTAGLTVAWTSEYLPSVDLDPSRIAAADLDADGYTDVLVGTARSVEQFEAAERYPPPPVANEGGAGTASFGLRAVYPNPFTATATVQFALPEAGRVTLEAYDVLGRCVAVLADAERGPGLHRVRWAPEGLGTGVYTLRLRAGGRIASASVVLAR